MQEDSGAILGVHEVFWERSLLLRLPAGPKDKLRRMNQETIALLVELKDCTDPFLMYL